MAAPNGHKRYGGRKKGTPNKATTAKAAEIAASGLTPLDFMLSVMRDELRPFPDRLDAAKSAAPYVHPKLAAIEHTGKDGGPMTIKHVSAADRRKAVVERLAQLAALGAGRGGHVDGGNGVPGGNGSVPPEDSPES